jgi:RNA polymerase sigma factor (sigma-70 family)
VSNPPDDSSELSRLIGRLASPEPQEAWDEFLTDYSSLIRQVILAFEQDPDHASDCFLFVCEKLCEDRFRRLVRFKPGGTARFSTWLKVVIRNLCLDWHRKEFGRQQIFQTIAGLVTLDQEVFRTVYHQGLSNQDCYSRLRGHYPDVTLNAIEESLNRIQQALSPRQLWLLQMRRPRFRSLESETGEDEMEVSVLQIADPSPGPETLAFLKEQHSALERALSSLEPSERLLLKLRFDQGLTLQVIAHLMNLKDAQTADRRLRTILEGLRNRLVPCSDTRGKAGAPSV